MEIADDLAPKDDPTIPCQVRLWHDGAIIVFVHPREWKRIVAGNPMPVIVNCHSYVFPAEVASWGEFYRSGSQWHLCVDDFPVPWPGDYDATARIDWLTLIPEVLLHGLQENVAPRASWLELSCTEMREEIALIRRARLASSQLQRSLDLLGRLSG